ncbi:umecyanin-like [Lycium ferocissimum]|uniref:umecyanin-like n=1 Tax=Lycium ferocissimum TaxID=112874 RepID=UPI002815706A|nr:umecyanin-like [Lycium ferocissimum]
MEKMLEFVSFILVLVCVISCGAAETHNVGGDFGWNIPGGKAGYQKWAANQTFKSGDNLVFTWTGEHTVANVSKEDFEKCTTRNDAQSNSPVSISISGTGPHYFICTIGKHCSFGQKLNITAEMSAAASAIAINALLSAFFVILSIAITM